MGIAYFLTHPIQYQTPLLQALKASGEDVHVLYASTTTTWDEDAWQKRVPLTWDVPLLENYAFSSLDNQMPSGGFWHQVIRYRALIRRWLLDHPCEMAWIHGWGNPYALAALLEARRAGLVTYLRGETHLGCLRGTVWRKSAHRVLLKWLFSRIDKFLAIGTANREFYQSYGVPGDRIAWMPYVVDNEFFRRPQSPTIVAGSTRFPPDPQRPIVLFVGKLVEHKAVDVLIQGFARACKSLPPEITPRLVIVGEGDQRSSLESLANQHIPNDVWFAGFRNQTELPDFYAMADIFVLPSRFEPWGLVVNEAMNAAKPVIVSNKVGAGFDLVKPGENGSMFPSDDIEGLASALTPLLCDASLRHRYGQKSLDLISKWGIPEAVRGWKDACNRQLSIGSEARPSTPIPVGQLKLKTEPLVPVRGTISISYAYVHNAYQQAQAAADYNQLEKFYCSCVDASGYWGDLIGRLAGREAMASRGGVHLPDTAVTENPWPLLRGRLRDRLTHQHRHDWLAVSAEFDHWVAPRLERDPCDLLLCYETGARESFINAKQLGKRCLLDCPQFHPDFLWDLLAEAADHCSMPAPLPIDTPATASRKRDEFSLADHLLVYSPLHAASFEQAGFHTSQMLMAPLWIDPELWYPEDASRQAVRQGPLRLLFVGGASLRKGIPFLLDAVAACGRAVHLTFAGEIDDAMAPLVAARQDYCSFVGRQTKPALRRIYAKHDLLVLPSVADAFGFVAMEAMACGLPVVVSDKCGVPVPDETWRVPALDAHALEARFLHYVRNPEQILADSCVARDFAKGFTASQFRQRMKQCFDQAMQ